MINSETQEYITNKQIDVACKRQMNKNLREKGRSTSWASMTHYIRDYLLEYQSDNDIWIVKKGWRNVIKNIT